MKKAIVFDCWGTLFRNEGINPFAQLVEELADELEEHKVTRKIAKNLMTQKHEDIEGAFRGILEDLNIQHSEEYVKELEEIFYGDFLTEVVAYSDSIDVLESLRGNYMLGLLTDTDYVYFSEIKDRFPVEDLFDTILTSYEAGVLKPNLKFFELILRRMETKPQEAIMIGDSLERDIEPAKEVGMDAILLDRRNRYSDYPRRVESLKELQREL